jgi:hypothetical protein
LYDYKFKTFKKTTNFDNRIKVLGADVLFKGGFTFLDPLVIIFYKTFCFFAMAEFTIRSKLIQPPTGWATPTPHF